MQDDEATARRNVEARLGTILADKYRLTRVLGVGGMGAVYEAINTWTERRVAVKVMLARGGGDLASRFMREARAAAKLAHPNIVDVLDMGQNPSDGALYIVQEFLVGADLRRLFEERRVLTPREAVEIVAPLMSALVAVHRSHVVHRDIKPENIFLAKSPTGQTHPKLIDFGIAKVVQEQSLAAQGALTRTGAAMGTPFYMSPEQARGVKDIDAQTDVWAIGVVLYEALAGRVPWTAENYNALMVEILAGKCPRLDEVAREVPREAADVVHRALELDRTKRYATMYEFLLALLDCPAFGQESWITTLRDSYRTLPEPLVLDTTTPPPVSVTSSGEQATTTDRRATEVLPHGGRASSGGVLTSGTAPTMLQVSSSTPGHSSSMSATTPVTPSALAASSPSSSAVPTAVLRNSTTTGRAGTREVDAPGGGAGSDARRGRVWRIVAALALVLAVATSVDALVRRRRRAQRGAAGGGETTQLAPTTDVDEMLRRGSVFQTQGRDRDAYEMFRQAYETSRRPQARAQMGIAAQAMGRWIESVQALHGAMASEIDPWIQRNRPALDAALAAAQRHVALVEVQSPTPGAEVYVNGDRIGSVPLDEPLCLLDGVVRLEVRAPGHRPLARELTVAAGRTFTEQFELEPLRPAGEGAPQPPRRRPGTTGGGAPRR